MNKRIIFVWAVIKRFADGGELVQSLCRNRYTARDDAHFFRSAARVHGWDVKYSVRKFVEAKK